MHQRFEQIAQVFAQNGLTMIALKGIYVSEWLYEDIGLRQSSDIDVLIPAEDGQKCIDVLKELGYKTTDSKESDFVVKIKTESIHYTPMVMDGVIIELHTILHRVTEKYCLPIDALWQNSLPTNKLAVRSLDSYDLLIHLCVHLDKHFVIGKIQFTGFSDITNLLDKVHEQFDWHVFALRCKAYNCVREVFKYIILTNKFFDATVPAEIVSTYSSMLNAQDEIEFKRFLNGNFDPFTAVPFHSANLQQINSFGGKCRYIFDIVFPRKEFMILKYHIKHPVLYLFYYPYRYFTALKGYFYVLQKKIRKGGN